MLFQFNFYSSILLIFFVHMLVYSILFFLRYRKQQQPAACWMSLFVLLAALYIAPWMLGFSGWYDNQPYRDILFYVPFQHLFLLGPVVYFYVTSLFNPKFTLTGRSWLHFLPGVLYLLFCIVVVVYDKLISHSYYFLRNEEDPDFDTWYQLAGFISMIIYFGAAIRHYYAYKKAIETVLSNAADFLFNWVRNFLVAFLLILIARFTVFVLSLVVDINYDMSWWYFLAFSISCYYIAIAGYSNAVQTKILFRRSFFAPATSGQFFISPVPKKIDYLETPANDITFEPITGNETIESPSAELLAWKDNIQQLFEADHVYENPELTLFDLAGRLNTNVTFLSKVINQVFQSGFNDLVNSYRVKRFMTLVAQGQHKTQTLLALAYECGFNSKTTFNRAFKKITDQTPQQYVKQQAL